MLDENKNPGAWSLVCSVLLCHGISGALCCRNCSFFLSADFTVHHENCRCKMSSSTAHAEGSSPRGRESLRTIDNTMRELSTAAPVVVVLDSVPLEEKPKVFEDPKKDLWLSTVDG